jgi:hypothetical protein
MMLSSTLISANSARFWKVRAIPRPERADVERRSIGWPSNRMVPMVGR